MVPARLRTRASSLLELVVGIGILGLLLVVMAQLQVSTFRGGQQSRLHTEACEVAQNVLEQKLAGPFEALDLSPQPPNNGEFRNHLAYQVWVQPYSLGGTGPATGLSDDRIKGLRVTLRWTDQYGSHEVINESYKLKISH